MLIHQIHHNNGILTVRVPVSLGEKMKSHHSPSSLQKKLSTRLNFRQGVTKETGIGASSHSNDSPGTYCLRSWLSIGMLMWWLVLLKPLSGKETLWKIRLVMKMEKTKKVGWVWKWWWYGLAVLSVDYSVENFMLGKREKNKKHPAMSKAYYLLLSASPALSLPMI